MISVCMATFNGAKYICQQLNSVLSQLQPDDEVIISDDSSTDGTIEIIKNFNDRRIKLFENCNYKSPIFNFENALKQSTGEYIFLCDQDDLWHKDKIKITLQYLKENKVVVSDCNLIDEDGVEIHSSFFQLNHSKPGLIRNFFKNSYLGCCLAFDRSILNAILPFPRKIAMHDIWIGFISELITKPVFLSEKLISYRRHSSNFSPTSQKSKFTFCYKVIYRIQLGYYAILRVITIKLR